MRTRVPVLLIHLLFLATFIGLSFTIPPLDARLNLDADEFASTLTLHHIIAAAGYYLNYYYFIPVFNLKRKYISYAAALVLTAIAGLYVPVVCNVVIDWLGLRFYFVDALFMPLLPLFIVVYMLSYILRRHNEWKQAQRDKIEMEMQKNAAEVILLKNQINPHFFFNTLNGIYSMAIQQSNKTPAAILQLSHMMRYVLYDSDEEKVPLENEIAYMQGYIEMQQIRLSSNNKVTIEVKGTSNGLMITPLLMIPFIENNFKYGISGDMDTRMFISIDCTDGILMFVSRNTIVSRNDKSIYGGIGISNVKRRLELTYHKRYDLRISEQGDEFVVQLKVKL